MNFKAQIMDEAAVERTLVRIAHQIIEKNHGTENLCLIGIKTRGIPLAERLAKNIEAKEACSACYGSLIHALQRLSEEGTLQRLPGTLHIGQGFRGQAGQGIGIGQCASGFSTPLPGCPPTARNMVAFLTQQLRRK